MNISIKIKSAAIILRRILLVILTAVIIFYVGAVLERKTVNGAWNHSVKIGGFKNEPSDSFDVMGFGSSHMYCTLSPLRLYEKTGLRSYVLATQQQPVTATYYYIKEALKTQSPDIIIVEASRFVIENGPIAEGVAHDAIDPFPFSLDKLRMIHEMDLEGSRESYYVNLIKYHTRWEELTPADFDFSYKNKTDPYHGFVFLTDSKPNSCAEISYKDIEESPLNEKNIDVLKRIKTLAEENDAKFMLLVSPYLIEENLYGSYSALHRFAEENGIDILDLNIVYDKLFIDNDTDFYDSGHLNVFGADKTTDYIGDYLIKNYGLSPRDGDDETLWNSDIKLYNDNKNKALYEE